MECQNCQIHPATLHFTKIVNGEKMEMHLCEQCAKNKGDMIYGQNNFSIHQLLTGLLNFDQPFKNNKKTNSFTFASPKCEKCGMTYEQFAKIGRFGCANCYETFDAKLDPLLKRVHSGNQTHSGKIPKRGAADLHVRKKIALLKETMQDYIEKEEFEKAALIRDELRSLEKQYGDEKGE